MERSLVLVLLLVFFKAQEASIIFPGQLDHTEGDDCRTSYGGPGICSRSCKLSFGLRKPSRCGITDSGFLVCCETRMRSPSPEALTDITPPRVSLECGRNLKAMLLPGRNTTGGLLRPEAATPTRTERNVEPIRPLRYIPVMPELPKVQKMNVTRPKPEVSLAIGGINALKNAWPWMALIGERDEQGIRWFCGGVLINEHWILSALHCFFHNSADLVRLGEHNYNDDLDGAAHKDFQVAETVNYPNFKFGEAYHDLALLRLKGEIRDRGFHIRPVCLPWGTESQRDIIHQKAILTGWGDTLYGGFPSSILQEVNVTVFPSSRCDRGYSILPHYPDTWPQGIGEETLCAGDLSGGRDACQGDSGGPLVSQDADGFFVLAGIVSQGYGCGHKDYPGLYVNIRHLPYLAWIKQVAFNTPEVVLLEAATH